MLKKIDKLLMKQIKKMMPSCKVVTRKISESYDRRLTLLERIQIRMHTWQCELCERYRQQLMAIHNLLYRYGSHPDTLNSDIALSEEAKERIKRHLRESSH